MKYDKDKFTLPQRVCYVLEGLTGLHMCGELANQEFVNQVYRFCHIANQKCKNEHKDWMREFEEVEEEMIWAYYTSPKEKEKIKNDI